MADISVTAASVANTGGQTDTGTAGASITAGQILYKDASANNTLKPASCASTAAAAVCGMALNGGASGQPITFAKAGATVTAGATLGVGTIYVLSDGSGTYAPVADLATGDKVVIVGYATSSTVLTLLLKDTVTTKA
jgi:hypothetical protein